MTRHGLPPAQGLYDPAATSTTPAASASWSTSRGGARTTSCSRRSQVLVNLEHRGAAGAEKNTGDGAGILLQIPARLPARASRGAARVRSSRAPGRYAVGMVFLPTDAPSRRRLREDAGGGGREPRGSSSSAGATSRPTTPRLGAIGPGQPAGDPADLRRRGRRCPRRRDGLRAQAVRDPPPRRRSAIRRAPTSPARREFYVASLSCRTVVYKGMLNAGQLRDVLPGPVRPGDRVRHRHGALALLDQHLPVLVARPPVPLHLAQRRDQHAARQHQLDARAPER